MPALQGKTVCNMHKEELAYRCSFFGLEEHCKFAQVLSGLGAHYACHESAPIERHGDANRHLIQPNVALRQQGCLVFAHIDD